MVEIIPGFPPGIRPVEMMLDRLLTAVATALFGIEALLASFDTMIFKVIFLFQKMREDCLVQPFGEGAPPAAGHGQGGLQAQFDAAAGPVQQARHCR